MIKCYEFGGARCGDLRQSTKCRFTSMSSRCQLKLILIDLETESCFLRPKLEKSSTWPFLQQPHSFVIITDLCVLDKSSTVTEQ